MNDFKDKNIFITGVCGAVGGEMLRQVLAHSPARVVGIDNNESALFFMAEEYGNNSKVRLFIGDVRDGDALFHHMIDADIVLHTAALKHVILCEGSPADAVQTNIIGVQNIINAALSTGASKVLFTSSDKAVNPTNVMGTTKLMGERLLTAANTLTRGDGPIFFSSRFGNVLGSSGSVVPLFKKQIAGGGPVTVTDREMTRFIMTLEQAVRLTFESVELARGGEVFITKMPVAKIIDLAEIMIEELAEASGHDAKEIKIKIIGAKAGEKMHEELLSEEERRRTVEMENYFVVKPAFEDVYKNIEYKYANTIRNYADRVYNSSVEPKLTKEELREFLIANNVL